MKKTFQIVCALLACGLAPAACGNSDPPRPDPSKGAPSGAPQPASTAGVRAAPGPTKGGAFATTPSATPGPAAAGQQVGYSMEGIKTIPDSCATPVALLATAPGSVGDDYAWPISRQAFLANQQFKVVDGAPVVPGQVRLATHKYNDTAYALVATCNDGGTCNRVAAMYKGIVRSSHPQLVCGRLNGISASPVGSGFGWAADARQNLPVDTVGKCARLNACMIATDRATPGDPFLECQKAPMGFKTECASRYPCSEVLSCAGK